MKKFLVLALLALACAGLVAAEGLNLGAFPLGSWLDANYDAVWEFTSGNVRIVSPSGELYYDFGKATVEGLKVGAGAEGATLSFSCKETGKFYKFTKPLTSSALILEIDPPWKVHYKVEMAKR
ncbi:MAG TPA: hypothetical protein P5165_01640 [Spirochaetia bacterium]|nr:hypothetical protein [Spirochaetia bacterium]